jgi:hypothetical protein
LLDKQ